MYSDDLRKAANNAYIVLQSYRKVAICFGLAHSTETNLPNVTSLSLEECIIGHPNFLRGLLRLEDLNLKGTTFMDDSDVVTELPVSITALNIRSYPQGLSLTLRFEKNGTLPIKYRNVPGRNIAIC